MSSPEIRGDWVVWLVRSLMVGLSTVVLSLVSYMGNRIVSTQDKVDKSLHAIELHAQNTNSAVERIQQEMALRRQTQEARDDEVRATLTDHETRLRVIERHRQN